LIAAGIITIGLRISYIIVRDKDEREWEELVAEFKFVFKYAQSAWSIGSGIACILVGAFLFFPVNGQYYERYQGGLGIYLAVLGITLGVHALYRREAPIVNIFYFLDLLINDLLDEKKDKLWIVFPALNIGYYRAIKVEKTDKVERFKKALGMCAARLQSNAVAITHPQAHYEKLYRAYVRMAVGPSNDERVKERVKECAQNASDFLREFVDLDNQGESRRGRFYSAEPDTLPPTVIIIGSVVYFIITYSMPVFDKYKNEYSFPTQTEHRPAEVIVYRKDDSFLANSIVQSLTNWVGDRNPEMPIYFEDRSQEGASAGWAPAAMIEGPGTDHRVTQLTVNPLKREECDEK